MSAHKQHTQPSMDQAQSVDVAELTLEALMTGIMKITQNDGKPTDEGKRALAAFLDLYTQHLTRKITREVLEQLKNQNQ